MDKDKILEKARSSKKDEREQQIEIGSFRIGWIAVTVIILVLIGFRFYYNESPTDLLLILTAQISAASFYQYKQHVKNKEFFLVAGIGSLIGFLLAFAALLSEYEVY